MAYMNQERKKELVAKAKIVLPASWKEKRSFNMAKGPFKAELRSGYWIAIDTRSGKITSYPAANERKCKVEVSILNRAYAEAVAEMEG